MSSAADITAKVEAFELLDEVAVLLQKVRECLHDDQFVAAEAWMSAARESLDGDTVSELAARERDRVTQLRLVAPEGPRE